VKVSKGQVARVEVLMSSHDEPTRGYAGLTFEDQLGAAYVKWVDANGPAARAGIAVGDVVRTIDGRRLPGGAPDGAMEGLIESHVSKPIKLGLERGDKDFEVTLTVETRP
jgi:S1-C subfamily serine protease